MKAKIVATCFLAFPFAGFVMMVTGIWYHVGPLGEVGMAMVIIAVSGGVLALVAAPFIGIWGAKSSKPAAPAEPISMAAIEAKFAAQRQGR